MRKGSFGICLMIALGAAFCILFSGISVADTHKRTSISLTAHPLFDQNSNFRKLEIRLKISKVDPQETPYLCFWLPYEGTFSPENLGFAKRFKALSSKASSEYYSEGYLKLVDSNQPTTLLHKQIMRVDAKSSLEMTWEAKPPKLAGLSGDYELLDRFYPVLLENCPESFDNPSYRADLRASYDLNVQKNDQLPAFWSLHPGLTNQVRPHLLLTKKFQKQSHVSVLSPETKIEFIFKTEFFKEQIKSIIENLEQAFRLFGPYPNDKLVFMETESSETLSIPGFIGINPPRQGAFKYIQSDMLNFNHWIYTQLIFSSFVNSSFEIDDPCHEWLQEGLTDFLASKVLSSNPLRKNILNSYKHDQALIEFDYEQLQEITANLLKKEKPNLRLVEPDPEKQCVQNHAYTFIRQSLALRAALFGIDNKRVFQLAYDFLKKSSKTRISPESFIKLFIEDSSVLSSGEKKRALRILHSWWTRFQWPDFKLKDYNTEELADNTFLTDVKIYRPYSPHSPLPVTLKNESNATRVVVRSNQFDNKNYTLSIKTNYKPEEIILDHNKEIFDFNRFDNQSSFPGLKFFPGNAKTLYSSDYTAVWLPTLAKNPGENFSFGLNGLLFKYLHSNFTFSAQTMPSNGKSAFSLQSQTYFADADAQMDLLALKSFDGVRSAEANFTKFHLLFLEPHLFSSLNIKTRDFTDNKISQFSTSRFNLGIEAFSETNGLYLKGLSSTENVLWFDRVLLDYNRRSILAEFGSKNWRLANLSMRFYKGWVSELEAGEEVLNEIQFNPNNLEEARFRSNLHDGRMNQVNSFGLDLYISAPIPLPEDLMVLNRRIKTRLYFDRIVDHDLSAAGFGFKLPLGGDISGAGSVPITHFNLLVTLYSKNREQVSRAPQYFFSLAGGL